MISHFKLKLTAALLLGCNVTFAQTDLQKAWKAFFNNHNTEATTLFNTAAKQKESTAEALLGLSLVSQMNGTSAQSFDYFTKFIAQSDNPQPYIYALWMTPSINENYNKKTPQQLAFIKTIADNKTYDGTLAAMASQIIGKHYEAARQLDKADPEYNRIGAVDDWQITGEFENISTSGFDKNYADVLNHPEAEAQFISKLGAKIGWHTVQVRRHDHWIDYEYYNDSENSIEFAQSFVNAPEDINAQLRIGVSGSVKVWVNDALILSEAEERNNDLDTYIQPIKLNKGYNRILVQIGESYCNSSNFMVRITDDNGHALSNLTYAAEAKPYSKAGAYTLTAIEPLGIKYFNNKLKQNADDDFSKILLANAYLRAERDFEARRLLDDLHLKYPQSTYINLLLLQLFNRENNRTGAETIKETIKNADPESSSALVYKYADYVQQKNYDKAADVVKDLERLHPEQAEIIMQAKIGVAGYQKQQDELVKLGEQAYINFPDNRDVVNLKYAIEKELHKNASSALAVLKKYVDNNNDYGMAKTLSQAYFTAGDANMGYKVIQEQLNAKPYATGIYSYLGNQYYNQQKYDKAEESYLKSISIAPTISSY
ncbi:tetratricopeptide repeat protein [Mucilaginibacter sp. KACC 22063]|uniref:tetratricopeptide repeat protein n=1 Tax=Mucilaginibacter sp. KACC 22063 TaxID=3025666 RepID=UPI002365E2C3|nr:tetratricopeptide repeat protein [Mucilaginibacter sp. KACC 22063]WDF55353.1 tetratricopeptide repeat protein [Mucilaginibacter sp. KACC 22063]